MHRLIKTHFSADGRRGQHPQRSAEHRRLVREDVAEKVLGDDYVERAGMGDEAHGAGVHVHVVKFDFGIVAAYAGNGLPPELRGLEYVGLVHRSDLPAAFLRLLERNVGHTLDLRYRVAHGVVRSRDGAVADSAGLPEVDPAQQLTHDQDVGALDDLGAQGRAVGNGAIGDRRTQIGITAQRLPQSQQPGFRLLPGRQRIELRPSHGAEQHGLAVHAGAHRCFRQRRAALADSSAPNRVLFKTGVVAVKIQHRAQDAHRFPRNLRANSVARQNRDVQLHCSYPGIVSRVFRS